MKLQPPHCPSFSRPLAAALFCATFAAGLAAQTVHTGQTGQTVTITGRSSPALGVGGFGGQPLADTPLAAAVIGSEQMADLGLASPAALTRLDPAFSDAYNAEGYWSSFTARGFVLDNRSNFRRDGLPINAETALQLGNVDRVELLRGASGIQAGTSAPGGLVNLVVKRPTRTLRVARLEWQQDGTLRGALDWSERGESVGLRVNAGAARLDPRIRDARGRSAQLALATDLALGRDGKLEFEFERSHQRQPSAPGFSLLGSRVPDPETIDPRLNLNNQPWSLPVVFDNTTTSLRWQQRLAGLGEDWRLQLHGATQRLKTDDRIAFPFGCTDGADYYADRFCPDGRFDLYDFRSEGERRSTSALDAQLSGTLTTGAWRHELTAGVLGTRVHDRFGPQAFNFAGQGRIDGSLVTPAAPDLFEGNPPRRERSTEAYLRDAVTLGPATSLWLGLRHTRLERGYAQSFTTPWIALGQRVGGGVLVYASWGQGVESERVPERPRYANAGEALPALKSRQWEIGAKHGGEALEWSVAAFDIRRPRAADIGACDVDASCLRRIDGAQRHRGLEGAIAAQLGPWSLQAGGMLLRARREGASESALNGREPENVPRLSLKLLVGHDLAFVPGLNVSLAAIHEGSRQVLPDNSVQLPGWTRLDLAARWTRGDATWRLGVDNLLDERAWRESPYQFGHAYLFPLAPRTLRASLALGF